MPSIRIPGMSIPTCSNLYFYFLGVIFAIAQVWEPISAIWWGRPLEANWTLFGLISLYIMKPYSSSSMFFQAAWETDLFKKRLILATLFATISGVAIWDCFAPPLFDAATADLYVSYPYMTRINLWGFNSFLCFGFILTEWEAWREERSALEEKCRALFGDEKFEQWAKDGRDAAWQQWGLYGIWNRGSVLFQHRFQHRFQSLQQLRNTRSRA